MWTIDEGDHGEARAPSRPDCPGCGEPDLHGDDFCHECGHGFEHFARTGDASDGEVQLDPCPMCPSGELARLDHGRTQCDSCGFMVRDAG